MDGVETVSGVPQKTTSVSSTDTAQSIPAGSLSGLEVEELLIVVETAAVRFGFGGTVPTQAGLGIKVDPGGSIRIRGKMPIAGTQFISAAASTPGKLQIVSSVV